MTHHACTSVGVLISMIPIRVLRQLVTLRYSHSSSTPNRFLFFQAEDGIRDYKVTGVQTCALPIWRPDFVLRNDHPHVCHRTFDSGEAKKVVAAALRGVENRGLNFGWCHPGAHGDVGDRNSPPPFAFQDPPKTLGTAQCERVEIVGYRRASRSPPSVRIDDDTSANGSDRSGEPQHEAVAASQRDRRIRGNAGGRGYTSTQRSPIKSSQTDADLRRARVKSHPCSRLDVGRRVGSESDDCLEQARRPPRGVRNDDGPAAHFADVDSAEGKRRPHTRPGTGHCPSVLLDLPHSRARSSGKQANIGFAFDRAAPDRSRYHRSCSSNSEDTVAGQTE